MALVAVLLSGFLGGCRVNHGPQEYAVPAAPAKEIRALWVTRGEYGSADDVRRLIASASAAHFNMILFQVRGNGTVFYRSKIEPWAWELTSDSPRTTGKDPGWDPLAVAIEQAHKSHVELHAWINIFPAWRSQNYPPKDVHQLWWDHPDWFMCDAAGQRMIPRDHHVNAKVQDWYSFLSPGVPAVQTYIADVCEELVRNYHVAGIHYDYIRYPREIREIAPAFAKRAEKLGNWSYDPLSLRRFTSETGASSPDADPAAWSKWRADQVTATVRQIAQRVRPLRPDLIISAAVGADPDDARNGKYQDYVQWLDKGYLDAAITMNYVADMDKFTARAKLLLEHRPARGLIAQGLGMGNPQATLEKQVALVRALGADGMSAFSSARLFDRKAGYAATAVGRWIGAGPFDKAAVLPWAPPGR